MSDTTTVELDPWVRFDHWAEQAHQAAQGAIEAEQARGQHNDCTGGVCDAYSRAADIYRALANAARPGEPLPPTEIPTVVTIEP